MKILAPDFALRAVIAVLFVLLVSGVAVAVVASARLIAGTC